MYAPNTVCQEAGVSSEVVDFQNVLYFPTDNPKFATQLFLAAGGQERVYARFCGKGTWSPIHTLAYTSDFVPSAYYTLGSGAWSANAVALGMTLDKTFADFFGALNTPISILEWNNQDHNNTFFKSIPGSAQNGCAFIVKVNTRGFVIVVRHPANQIFAATYFDGTLNDWKELGGVTSS